jgi:hypothetical protein
MLLNKILLAAIFTTMSVSVSGCAVVSVASAAVTVASTAVSVGVTAGSMAVGAATTVAKGAVSVGGAIVGDDDEESDE